MSKQKLTGWFVKGEKPVRKGVYNVSCQREHQSGRWWSYWDGVRFLSFSNKRCETAEYGQTRWEKHRTVGAGNEVLAGGSWRGLAHPPKAKP